MAENNSTVLGSETSFKGTMRFNDSLKIDGFFEGNIESEGFLYIEKDAEVRAQIKVGTIIVGGKVISLNKDMEADCKNGCPPSRYDDMDKLDKLTLTTDILIGAGAALAVAGGSLLVVNLIRNKKSEKEIAIVPICAPQFAGFAATGSF